MEAVNCFCKKRSIKDIWHGCNYFSEIDPQICEWTKKSRNRNSKYEITIIRLIPSQIRRDTTNGNNKSVLTGLWSTKLLVFLLGNIFIYFQWISKVSQVDKDFAGLYQFENMKLALCLNYLKISRNCWIIF